MSLIIKNIHYNTQKEVYEITEPQALLLVSDILRAAMVQSGFSCEISFKDDDADNEEK